MIELVYYEIDTAVCDMCLSNIMINILCIK